MVEAEAIQEEDKEAEAEAEGVMEEEQEQEEQEEEQETKAPAKTPTKQATKTLCKGILKYSKGKQNPWRSRRVTKVASQMAATTTRRSRRLRHQPSTSGQQSARAKVM